MKVALVLCALVCAIVLPLSCLGPKVDRLALFEPAQLAWPAVRSDLEAGVADGVSEGAIMPLAADALLGEAASLEDALELRDQNKLRLVAWPTLKPWAERGIEAKLGEGTIGPGVAESFREHLRNFDEVLQRLRGVEL